MIIDINKYKEAQSIKTVSTSNRYKRPANVKVASEVFVDPTPKKRSYAAEPIKNIEDIIKVQDYLIANKRYRDNLIFTMGINFGLRCGDLVQLKVGNIITEDGSSYRNEVVLQEEKTKKYRTVYMNDAVCDAADLYFNDKDEVNLNDYLFVSESNNGKNTGKHIAVRNVERMLKEVINEECGINVHASTHCLRKTFAYHVILNAPDRSRAIEFLMKILGHSSPSITLMYAGITSTEIESTYHDLNLGRKNPFDWNTSSGLENFTA